jgi:CO/xanthine dehydrogenase FAD-binding subunit
LPYCQFHTGYKQNAMTADELLYAIHLPRRFAHHRQYLRKVGTRRAMAISKVALGGTSLVKGGVIEEVRVAAASLAPYPIRLVKTQAVLLGNLLNLSLIKTARNTLLAEAQPIDDIRSNAQYRKQVGANLLEEFLRSLGSDPVS